MKSGNLNKRLSEMEQIERETDQSRGGVAGKGSELCGCSFCYTTDSQDFTEFDRLVWSGIIGLPLQGSGGGLSRELHR